MFRQRCGNEVARLIHALVVAYVGLSPIDRGKSRLRGKAAMLISRIATFKEQLMPVAISGQTLRLWLTPSSIVGASVSFFGNFEVAEVDACMRALAGRPNPVLLDVGANCGLYSLFAAGSRTDVRVVAVEPDPDTLALFRRNIAENADVFVRNRSTIEVVDAALSATSGESAFIRSWDNGFGSLCVVTARRRDTIAVRVRRGDELVAELAIDEIDVCKIDVEGGELLVLQGLTNTLRAGKIRLLQLELNKGLSRRAGHSCGDLLGFLRDHDYQMTAASLRKYAVDKWECDNFYFVRCDKGDGSLVR